MLWFDIQTRLGRISTLIYFALFLALSFLLAITFGGAFKGVIVNFGLSNKLAMNSPIVLHYLTSSIGYFGLLIVAPIFGQSINQDFETGFHQILFATPIRKAFYFFHRYIASFVSSLTILLSIGLGLFLGTLMPFVDRTMVMENHLWFYLAPYLSNLIPNILIFGALFIAVIAVFKKMAPVYVASVVVFTGLLISQSLTGDPESKLVAALADPLGSNAALQVVRYWSVAEQSTHVVPLVGYLLYNRLLWGAIGGLFLTFAYLSFNPFRLPRSKKIKHEPTKPISEWNPSEITLLPRSWKVFYQLAISECRQAFSNVYVLTILLCGIIYMFVVSSFIGKMYGIEVMPVTYHVLDVIGGSFFLFVMIITAYYAGELVWKDRDQRVDAKPLSNFFLYFSKLLGLWFVQMLLVFIVFACCLLIQMFKGYFHFEWGVYVQHLFLYTLPAWFLISVLALFVHVISRNKYVGHSIVVPFFVLLTFLPSLGLDHHLYLMGVLPRAQYSDMNEFGTSLWPFTVFSLYWISFYVCLAVLTVLFWPRGKNLLWKDRLAEFRYRIRPRHKKILATSLCSFLALGCFIYYNTNVLNIYKTKSEKERELVDYERNYKQFAKIPQPELVSVNVQVDLFPASQSMAGKGLFKYRNRSSEPMKTVMLNLSDKSEVLDLTWSKSAKLTAFDKRLAVRIYEFAQPIQPNEEIELQFRVTVQPKGFANEEFSKKIVENGTFFYGNDFFPFLGYQAQSELAEDASRRKYGLPEKLRMPDINDQEAVKETYLSAFTSGGTWIDFAATISTSMDQIAIAPGYLQKEWTENGRRYFSYKMDKPILNFFAFLSGRYEVARDQWNDVKIEIYHHPSHTANITRMIQGVKKSLDYYTTNFSPYQFNQLRIIEFPRYEYFAQSFPNTIPCSEGMGFIAKLKPDDPESIDFILYGTGHEVGHQWWAHQVIGGNVQGATMLSESLAQYSALMVMEKEYGSEHVKKFLKYELDQYLHGRGGETKRELPLMLNENQPYIHYNKGSLVLYALKDYLGEEAVNRVLKGYIHDMAYQQPPFTRSIDLVNRFRAITPGDKQYLIEDLFETITLYANRTDSVSYKKMANGKYEVVIHSTNKKIRADELGREQEIPMDDDVDVGVFDHEGHLTYLQKHKVSSGQNQFRIVVETEPSQAGVDPLNKLIDKVSDGHVQKATKIF